jgi:signal transduction histidine kinase/ActR/RegA family two-component response regulator
VPAIVGFTSFALFLLRRRPDGFSVALLARAMESANASVVCVTHDDVVQSWSAGARSLYGYEAAEIIGRSLSMLGPVAHLGTTEHTTKDGRAIRVASIVSPIRDRLGRTIGRSIISRDVTRDTLVELELRQAREAAEAASAAKSAFLANMSHEIRTPMTAVIGYAELLLTQASLNPDDVRQWARIIYESGERLLSVINEILDLSKIEAGKLKIVRSACATMEVVGGVVALLEPQARAKGLTIDVECGDDVPVQLHTDPDRLRQILLNLVGNAIKFTSSGGVSIHIATQAPQDGRRQQICFDVTDTGAGVPADQRQIIFEHFGQAFAPSGCHGGTGLGLPIARKLAQLLGGDVALIRSDETGSHFRAQIETSPPAIRTAPSARAQAVSEPFSPLQVAGQVSVLLAEDCRAVREMLRQMLEAGGARVVTATDGAAAIDIAMIAHRGGRHFDTILMDMQMPHTDGFAAVANLRSRGYTGRIVALTANAMEGARERCLAAGCDDYLAKPVQRDALIRAIHNPAQKRVAA